jgi:hypothetical protein
MSQWTKHPVDVPFGSKYSVDIPLVDILSMHPISKHADQNLKLVLNKGRGQVLP